MMINYDSFLEEVTVRVRLGWLVSASQMESSRKSMCKDHEVLKERAPYLGLTQYINIVYLSSKHL